MEDDRIIGCLPGETPTSILLLQQERRHRAELARLRAEVEKLTEQYRLAHFDWCAESVKTLNLEEEVEKLRERKDGAYLERNRVVAALAKCFPSGTARTAIEGWSDDWHGCVYIDLPTGQVSWHFNDAHADLFADLPPYSGSWDGHDTDEKYRRLAELERTDGD